MVGWCVRERSIVGRVRVGSRVCSGGREPGGHSGAAPERLGARGGVLSAVAVVAAVALSGVFLVVFLPELWWVFTTYFWVAFPAVGRLGRGIAEPGAGRARAVDPERELLEALRRYGELTPGLAAAETSLSVAEADRRLGELAGDGHLEIRVRGGAIFYALWEAEPEMSRLAGAEDGP